MLAGSSSFYAGGVKPYDNLLFIIVTSEVPAGYGDEPQLRRAHVALFTCGLSQLNEYVVS